MRVYLLCIALFLFPSLRAQHYHFMYIQSDQRQPFYVKLGNEPLSSSAEGFLIIPRLKDSAYEMVIGFPAKKFPEYRFRFAGFRKDRGMALKNFGEKGWGLFDYQTTEVLMGELIPEQRAAKSADPAPLTSDAFTVVLASVIDDPGLLATPLVYMPAVEAPPPVAVKTKPQAAVTVDPVATSPSAVKKKDPAPAQKVVAKAEPQAAVTVDPVATPPSAVKKKDPAPAPLVVAKAEPEAVKPLAEDSAALKPADPAGIVRFQESQSAEGLLISYLDRRSGGAVDTISLLIPVADSSNLVKKTTNPDMELSKAQPAVVSVAGEMQPPKVLPAGDSSAGEIVSMKVLPAGDSADKGKAPVREEMTLTDSPLAKPGAQVEIPAGRPNRANCARMATEKDLGAVRKKMVGIRDEDEMVAVALKDFKARCYTTEQVKALCFVFTREEGRYKLIDAAYPYVYDPARFGELESLLSDKYFIHRFKALMQK